MEPFGKAIYGSYYLISFSDPKRARWHEIVLYVNDDKHISVLHFDAVDEIEFLKLH
jgi:hypothetical protein